MWHYSKAKQRLHRTRDVQVAAAVSAGKTLILDNVAAPLPLFVTQLLKLNLIVTEDTGERVR